MRYQIIAKPTDGININDEIKASDGTLSSKQVVCTAPAIPTGNQATVLLQLVNNTVQPNAAQLIGLAKYLTLIQSASATTTVETALAAL